MANFNKIMYDIHPNNPKSILTTNHHASLAANIFVQPKKDNKNHPKIYNIIVCINENICNC